MLRVEFHCHTHYSKDSLLHPQRLLDTCREKGLDRVVITDHNNNTGGLHAQRLDPGLAIPGEEVMTTAGELLAFFVTEEVPRWPASPGGHCPPAGAGSLYQRLAPFR